MTQNTFMLIDSSSSSATLNIAYNIVGGILTICAVELFRLLRKKLRHRHFSNIFGGGDESYRLVYAPLFLHPDAKASVPARPGGEPFVFTRKDSTNATFSASQTTSNCEIRAAGYLASALGKDGGRDSTLVDDESVMDKLNIDFVSFGIISNRKTIHLLNNAANDLAVPSLNEGFFVWKKTGLSMCAAHRTDLDYGIILKIHPVQFPERTWITCGGLGEAGTSGSAWFLSKKWKELEERAKGRGQFVALIAVEPGKDESAMLVNFGLSPGAH